MHISGEEDKLMEVSGLWLLRDHTEKHMLDANPDAEYYEWKMLATPLSDESKAKIYEFWCHDVDEMLEGKKILDTEVFK